MFTNEDLKKLLNEHDYILIGAGAGLSTAAGFSYGGEAFFKNFSYMFEKYGYTDMYSAGFHPFDNDKEKWWYWSKYIYLNRYATGALPLYKKLFSLIKDKDYFVLTTNVDHQFQKAGFSKDRLFYTQGDYGLFQCSIPCHQITYDNEATIMAMISEAKDHKIPAELIPICPICGKKMTTNLRADDRFVEDEGWKEALMRYQDFLARTKGKKILFLELGVGYNTPGIIKYPFWKFTKDNLNSTYVSINLGEKYCPHEIEDRSIIVDSPIEDIIK